MIGETERKRVLAWYDANARDLPWRTSLDPYAVWVSEMMLHQTQVASMLPHYERWMAAYPTVEALAEADEQEALGLWEGLGYYRRCRYLLAGARDIVAHGLPRTAEGWRRLPGVGEYTAGAVASIAFGEPEAVVDGNVERVFARFTACGASDAELRKLAWGWAEQVLDRSRPGDWNQALMELGATICTPTRPKCALCPLEPQCAARQSWRVESFPAPRKAASVIQLEHVVWVPYFEGRFGVRQIEPGEWWEGMWEFPRVPRAPERSSSEGDARRPVPTPPNQEPTTKDQERTEESLRAIVGEGWAESLGEIRHTVTRHRILVYASLVRCAAASGSLRWESPEALRHLPMPVPQRKILGLALRVLGL